MHGFDRYRLVRMVLVVFCPLFFSCCAGSGVDTPANNDWSHVPAADLTSWEDGKADGRIFDPNFLMEDRVFTDPQFLTVEDVNYFLEETPYDTRSFLADYREEGRSAAELIVEAALNYDINPLVLLVKLQVESSVIFRELRPTTFVLQRAMGCGCHDGDAHCRRAPLGLGPQLNCAARLFRNYLNQLENSGATLTGWAVNRAKQSADPISVTPGNKATAALYTYTPWVLRGQGGNWLFWNVYRKFASNLLADRPNHHWIGGACDGGCPYAEGQCSDTLLTGEVYEGSPFCTQGCTRFCPESSTPYTSQTFCVDIEANDAPEGLCASKCNTELYQDNGGCPDGFSCTSTARFGDPLTIARVCLPGDETPAEDLSSAENEPENEN